MDLAVLVSTDGLDVSHCCGFIQREVFILRDFKTKTL